MGEFLLGGTRECVKRRDFTTLFKSHYALPKNKYNPHTHTAIMRTTRPLSWRALLCVLLMSVCWVDASNMTFSPSTRDIWLWPFSSNSIWNLPIGSQAVYVDAQLGPAGVKGMFVDPDVLIRSPSSPLTNLYYSSAAWTGRNRCAPDDGNKVLATLPLPTNFILPGDDGKNYGTVVVMPDGRLLRQTQPVAKCTGSSVWTSYFMTEQDQYLDGLGTYGAHGGSGLSAIGGTIRLGELLPGAVIRHAMKMNIDASLHSYRNPCFRWPASTCDDYAPSEYGGKVPQLRPGSLMAIPASTNINALGLQTVPAKIIAQALQDYGAYVSDDTWHYDIFTLEAELSAAGDVRVEFQKTYGYTMDSNSGAWASDIDKIYQILHVVDSWNSAIGARVMNSKGAEGAGGGAPRQPWAPELPAISPVNNQVFDLYSDSVASGWTLSSSGTVSASSDRAFAGSQSQKLVTTGAWQSFQFSTNGQSLNGYNYLHFAMLSGQDPLGCIIVQAYSGSWSSNIPAPLLKSWGGVPVNTVWTVYNVPLSALGNPGSVTTVTIEDCSGNAGNVFYIDQVQFTSALYTVGTSGTSGATSGTSSGTTSGSGSTSGTSTTGGVPPPPNPPPILPTSPANPTSYVLFDDAVNSDWNLYSSGTVSTYTSDKYSGVDSLKLVTTASWQNFGFYSKDKGGVNAAGYTHLQFAIRSGQSGSFCFQAQAFSGTWDASLPEVSTADYGGYPTSSAWTLYTVPMSAFGYPSFVSTVLLTDCSGKGGTVFYADRIALIVVGPSGAASATVFDDTLGAGWNVRSDGQLDTIGAQKYAGTSSERLVTTAPWQNYNFYPSYSFSTAGFSTFHFVMLGGQRQSSSCIQVQAFAGDWSESIPVADLAKYGGYPSDASWIVYNIPLSALGSPQAITTILITDCLGRAANSVYYLDQLKFT